MKLNVIIILFLIGFGRWSPAYSSVQDEYKRSLNGTWQFKVDPYSVGKDEEWFQPEKSAEDWDNLEVPGNWDLKNEYSDYAGWAWYRKSFFADKSWKNQAIRLYFESVYNDAHVWLNGKLIGEHHNGFLPFWFDIENSVRIGKENTLVLLVDNTFKRGAIWNWGGIRRSVWLEITDKTRLEYQHISSVPNLGNGTAKVGVEFEVSNKRDEDFEVQYQLEIRNQGKVIWKSSESDDRNFIIVKSQSSQKVSMDFQLAKSNVDLWHFNHPHLYTAQLKIYHDGKLLHQRKDRFGIRKVEIDGNQFKLNGETIKTVGFNLVPEDRVTGNTLPLWRIKEDIDMMKSLGVNMARMSHMPLPKAMLDYLDEKGIMIFEEVTLWGKDKMVDPDHPLPKYWLEKMVNVEYNHPCIIGWSVGNEIGFTDRNPKVMAYVDGAIQHAKLLDSTRLAIYVTHSAHIQQNDPVKYADMILYNAYGKWGEGVMKVHSMHGDKPIFMAEFGQHLNDENPNEAHINIKKMMDEFRGKPYMAGASLWTFNDYRSSWRARETWDTPPSQNRTWGVVNTFRQKKRPYYTIKKEYSPVKKLSVTVSGEDVKTIITPRNKLDIPSYKMEGYHLVYMIRNEDRKLISGNIVSLPVIEPGDKVYEYDCSLLSDQITSMQVSLLDPQAYSVLDTVIYFQPPTAPKIKAVHSSNDKVRVVFSKRPNVEEYKLRYGEDVLDHETEPTINHFVEIEDLKPQREYKFKLIAINGAGETESDIQTVRTDVDELPPIVWATVSCDNSFFVGYSVDPTDYLYEVKYGKEPGLYTKNIRVQTKGALQIPDLENGSTYYYRMRRRMQWGFASEWTDEIAVATGKELNKGGLNSFGLLKEHCLFVVFDPVEKAIGYQVRLRDQPSGLNKVYTVNKAQSGYVLLDVSKNLSQGSTIAEIRCQNEDGFSEWEKVEVKKIPPGSP